MSLSVPTCPHFFFLMIRRPPRSTLDRSSAASDVYKRQQYTGSQGIVDVVVDVGDTVDQPDDLAFERRALEPVSYTHLRAHETVLDLVCRLLLEKKKTHINIR